MNTVESVVSPRRPFVSCATRTAACSTWWRWRSTGGTSRCSTLPVAVHRRLAGFDALSDLTIVGGHLQYPLSLPLTRCFQTDTHPATQRDISVVVLCMSLSQCCYCPVCPRRWRSAAIQLICLSVCLSVTSMHLSQIRILCERLQLTTFIIRFNNKYLQLS